MSQPVIIHIQNLGKRYRYSGAGAKNDNLRAEVASWVKSWSLRDTQHLPPETDKVTDYFWALKDVDIEITQGEVVGIMGRNGAGKSTLLKILARITSPTTGSITYRGRVASLLEVGTGFHRELTGRENVFLNGSILGMKRTEIASKFDEIVAFSGIEKFIDTPVKFYSSGMYVRLAFAVAAHLESDILLVDEVLAVGDVEFQKKCLGKMSDVVKHGRTVLFVSHAAESIRSICTRGIWIDKGAVRVDGNVSNVVDQYLDNFVPDSQQTIDVNETSRPDRYGKEPFGKRLRISSVRVNDDRPVRNSEALTIRIAYETFTEIKDVHIFATLSSLGNKNFASFRSDVSGAKVDLAAGRSGAVQFNIDKVILSPGRYFLGVGAISGENLSLDFVPECCQIEVQRGDSTPAYLPHNPNHLIFPALSTWS